MRDDMAENRVGAKIGRVRTLMRRGKSRQFLIADGQESP